MPPGETRGRSGCILPEINGAVASIDGAGIAGETVAPCSGKSTDLVAVIETPRVSNPGWGNSFRQGQLADPELDRPSKLRPRCHRCQLCDQLIDARADTLGDKKLQAPRQAIQFSWPIRQGQWQGSAQRFRQFCQDLDGQVVDLAGMMQHVGAVRIKRSANNAGYALTINAKGVAAQPNGVSR